MKKLIILAIASAGILSFTGCADREPQSTTTTTEETTVHRPVGETTTTTETQAVRPY
ncbi:MAG: hypothetical protein WCD79_03110 [Chthoniobacteraceae bacterium]